METPKPYGVAHPPGQCQATSGEIERALQFLESGIPEAIRVTFRKCYEEIAVFPQNGKAAARWVAEPTRTFMLTLLTELRRQALINGLLLRVRGADEFDGRFKSSREVSIENAGGVVYIDGRGVGEALAEQSEMVWNPTTRRKETTGVMLADENAARVAETRALKRAVEVLGGGELAKLFVKLSEQATELAARLPSPTSEAVRAALVVEVEKRLKVKNGKESEPVPA